MVVYLRWPERIDTGAARFCRVTLGNGPLLALSFLEEKGATVIRNTIVMLILLAVKLCLLPHIFKTAFSAAILEASFSLADLVIELFAIKFLFLTDEFVKLVLVIVDFFE